VQWLQCLTTGLCHSKVCNRIAVNQAVGIGFHPLPEGPEEAWSWDRADDSMPVRIRELKQPECCCVLCSIGNGNSQNKCGDVLIRWTLASEQRRRLWEWPPSRTIRQFLPWVWRAHTWRRTRALQSHWDTDQLLFCRFQASVLSKWFLAALSGLVIAQKQKHACTFWHQDFHVSKRSRESLWAAKKEVGVHRVCPAIKKPCGGSWPMLAGCSLWVAVQAFLARKP